jgi:hypothetical protein
VNSTVSGNIAKDGGGAVSMYRDSSLTLVNSTITNNSAGISDVGGIAIFNNSKLILTNTIVAGNTKATSAADISKSANSTVTGSFSLIGDAATSGGLTHGVNGNIVGNAGTGTIPIATILQPLANNGGPTLTHALAANSPAINAGTAVGVPTTDQRGLPRVGAVDIGAFEVQPVATPAKLTSTKFGDGTAQRSNVTSITLTFDQPVTFLGAPEAAFKLQQNGAPDSVLLSADVNSNVVTLTFNGSFAELGSKSLTDGLYNLVINANQFTGAGFDGNGDGTAGDNFALNGSKANGFYRLFGDVSGDGTVDILDFNLLRAVMNTTPGTTPLNPFDFNGDGTIDVVDFNELRSRFNTSIP